MQLEQILDIENLTLKGMKLILENYQPEMIRDCYFRITRIYEESVMGEGALVSLFDAEMQAFAFLMEEIKAAGNNNPFSSGNIGNAILRRNKTSEAKVI